MYDISPITQLKPNPMALSFVRIINSSYQNSSLPHSLQKYWTTEKYVTGKQDLSLRRDNLYYNSHYLVFIEYSPWALAKFIDVEHLIVSTCGNSGRGASGFRLDSVLASSFRTPSCCFSTRLCRSLLQQLEKFGDTQRNSRDVNITWCCQCLSELVVFTWNRLLYSWTLFSCAYKVMSK